MPDQDEAMTRNHIIVGLDDSPSGRATLRWATQHALLGRIGVARHSRPRLAVQLG